MGRGDTEETVLLQPPNRLQKLFTPKKAAQQTLRRMIVYYPPNGNCPVNEQGHDGRSFGRCEFALRGPFCRRHGDLRQLLKPTDYRTWKLINESELSEQERMLKLPADVFSSELFSWWTKSEFASQWPNDVHERYQMMRHRYGNEAIPEWVQHYSDRS